MEMKAAIRPGQPLKLRQKHHRRLTARDRERATRTPDLGHWACNVTGGSTTFWIKGLAPGNYTLRAFGTRPCVVPPPGGVNEVSHWFWDEVEFTVITLSTSPTSGQIGSVITISTVPSTPDFFDDETTLDFVGTFDPEGDDPPTGTFTVSYPSDKVYYNAGAPDQVKIVLGEALPSGGDFWSNAGVQKRLGGVLSGILSADDCPVQTTFTATASQAQISHSYEDESFLATTAIGSIPVNNSTEVFNMTIWPYGVAHYIARVLVTVNEAPPPEVILPQNITAQLRMRRQDGTLVSNGLEATFNLYTASSLQREYRADRLILFNQSDLEGVFPEAYVLEAPLNSKIEIITQP